MKYLRNKSIFIFNTMLIALLLISNGVKADFGTLFTTASERKIIDDKRYLVKNNKPIKTTTSATIKAVEPQLSFYKTIEKEYKISGISIAHDGADTAWINNTLHKDGDLLDKKTHISIHAAKQKIRFTVGGRKTYYGQSGDVVTVSYRVPLLD